MAEPVPPPDQRPKIPTLLWAALALVLIVVFGLALRVLNPPASKIGTAAPEIVVPMQPAPAPLPDARPAPR